MGININVCNDIYDIYTYNYIYNYGNYKYNCGINFVTIRECLTGGTAY